MDALQIGILQLIKSALTGKKHNIPSDLNYSDVYKSAKAHRILSLIYHGILINEVTLDDELKNKFFTSTYQAIAVAHRQKDFLEKISEEFENAQIDFMPLKGSVIRGLYPKIEMRPMGDLDILFRPEQYEKIVPILQRMNMKFVKENQNELSWADYPLYVEFHRYLISPQHKDYFSYFGDGWRFARLDNESRHRYIMSDEDYYIYLFAHLTKHYRFSGIGIKHLVDIWVFLNAKPNLDMQYVESKLKQIKLLQFHTNVLKTLKTWFEGEIESEITNIITKKVFGSGAFGTVADATMAAAVKQKQNSKIKNLFLSRMLSIVFLPYKNMCMLFPILKKAPVLLPFFWIWRILYTFLFKNDSAKTKYMRIKNTSNEEVNEYAIELNKVGLDYNFKE